MGSPERHCKRRSSRVQLASSLRNKTSTFNLHGSLPCICRRNPGSTPPDRSPPAQGPSGCDGSSLPHLHATLLMTLALCNCVRHPARLPISPSQETRRFFQEDTFEMAIRSDGTTTLREAPMGSTRMVRLVIPTYRIEAVSTRYGTERKAPGDHWR
jgi:hypothetical protein